MKKILWTAALCLSLIPAKAQQTLDARKILDETASLFTSKGGVKATFKADNFTEGNLQGSATGHDVHSRQQIPNDHTGYDYLVQRRNAMELHES